MKYLIYLRVSTDLQTIETQEQLCKEYIAKEAGEVHVFRDEDVSSGIPMKDRLGLQDMLGAITKESTVLVYKLDRLSRDVIEMVTIYRQIKAMNGLLVSLCDPNCDDEFMMGLWGILAQKERKDIRTRIQSHMDALRSRDERAGTLPYGYTVDLTVLKTRKKSDGTYETKPYRLIPEESEQKVLQRMLRLHKEGKSFRHIAAILRKEGYKNRRGCPWQYMSVYRIVVRTKTARSMGQLLMGTKNQ